MNTIKKDFLFNDEVSVKKPRTHVSRKSYSLTLEDLDNLAKIKDRCLDRKVVVNDSHVVRMALKALMELSTAEIVKKSEKVERLTMGRPPGKSVKLKE